MKVAAAASLVIAAACGRIGFDERAFVVGDGGGDGDGAMAVGFSKPVAYGDITCAQFQGRPYCWGENGSGQVDPSTTDRSEPTEVIVPAGTVYTVSVGEQHACAIVGSDLYCWGRPPGSGMVQAPTLVNFGGSSVGDVAAGKNFICATVVKRAYCWGPNDAGQLGDGGIVTRNTPGLVMSAEPFVTVDAGDDHACGLTETGVAYCWGHNDDGALGFGAFNPTNQLVPTMVIGIDVLPRIAGWHACSLKSNTMSCWGRNSEGALGDGTNMRRAQPSPVPGFDAVTAIATGGGPADLDATCAVRTGELYCWGAGTGGRLGTGNTSDVFVPTLVANIPAPVVDVALGYAHTCALVDTGDIYCWGRGTSGQLGNGATANSLTPVRVIRPSGD